MWYLIIAALVFVQLTIEDHLLDKRCDSWTKNGPKNNAILAVLWLPVLLVLLVVFVRA